jgi:hypothetical protein
MMIEKEFSFERAMEIDEKVWSILPKIQARKVKELLGIEGIGLADFLQAVKVKFEAEGYDYEVRQSDSDHIQITVHRCPWYDILKKADREHLGPRIADSICSLELQVWLKEFGEQLSFSMEYRCGMGKCECVLDFHSD